MLVTSDHQAFLLAHLESSQKALETAVQAFSDSTWNVKPSPESWSGSECAEHVEIVASLILSRMAQLSTMPEEAYSEADSGRKDSAILAMTARRTKIEAPDSTRPTGRYSAAEQTLSAYRETNRQYCDIVQENPPWLRGRFLDHPVFQKLDGYQWILAVSCHTLRHVEQLREINEALLETPLSSKSTY